MTSKTIVNYDPTKESRTSDSSRIFQLDLQTFVTLKAGDNIINSEAWSTIQTVNHDVIDMLTESRAITVTEPPTEPLEEPQATVTSKLPRNLK